MKINDMPVVDATKKLQISITKKDIVKGDNKNPSMCAAAQCLLRLPKVTAARVHLKRTYVQIDKKWVRFDTPSSLRSEIIAFDRGGSFEPGTFTLGPIAPSHRLSGKRTGGRDKPKKKIMVAKKRPYHATTNVRAHGANR